MTPKTSAFSTVFQPGRVAVITGAAGGIGRATAEFCATRGMKLVLADFNESALLAAADAITAQHGTEIVAVPTDVSQRAAVERLCNSAYERFGEVDFLMNNAGRSGDGGLFGDPAMWDAILGVNLWGVIHGVQAFAPRMMAAGKPTIIVNTGSKQGITQPPGNTAYNLSKAGVKAVTEALAHELRSSAGCQVQAHLLVPGFTFTGMTRAPTDAKPAGAWTPDEVVAFMAERMEAGDFYIMCPDNDVTRDLDNARMLWSAMDVTENRPPLSRWHPDYAEAFKAFLAARGL
ncbi:SDR family NAD(P)-dependent oxidoreductase [Acidisoma cellulosilytica]|uniref:SDR family NAD(P)-dependent oxidoreductase n=1 Tax=Acidisoma cellulosilyticum TaxID=2802395 RepID=A0A963Z157_9PROT|nr:SDR family NAD(P)-dependent oxidoreductase [Acidisoma cellulosilyticum]MCB8880746.1 SDR family NAD(P)-dependent oxidoreductase [Acidisoma cellulosilyticum]